MPIWAGVYKKKHYIIIVSDTASQADDFLAAIKSEFEENDLLIDDFGDQTGLVWTASDIILKEGDVRIQSLGAGKKIRGRRFRQWRPDLIICDDLENDESVQSPDQRKKMTTWHGRALSKAGDERTDKVVIGTILHYDSLLANLLKNPIYKTKKYQSVIEWSTSSLWLEWEKIITNIDNNNRVKEAEAFFKEHEEEMLIGTKVLWPEKESYYLLMLQRIADGPAAFSSEKQNEPISDEDRLFSPEWIQYYEDEEILGKNLIAVGFVDPSLGKQGGDYSAIITLGADTNGQVYCLDADIARRHPDVIALDVIDKHKKFHYDKFGVEEVQFQEYFKDVLIQKANELGLSIPIKGIKVHKDKILRIQSLQPEIKNGTVKFKREQKLLIEQLINFPSADHDDGPDALDGALTLLGRRSAVAEYYQEKANEIKKNNTISFLQNPNLSNITQRISR